MWLLCVLLDVPVASAAGSGRIGGLVYCPLQKQWVKRSEPQPRRSERNPLDEICAGRAAKTRFIDRLSFGAAIGSASFDAGAIVDLFLDFAQNGERALAEVPHRPVPPKLPLPVVFRESPAAVPHGSADRSIALLTEPLGKFALSAANDIPVANFHRSRSIHPSPRRSASHPRAPPFLLFV